MTKALLYQTTLLFAALFAQTSNASLQASVDFAYDDTTGSHTVVNEHRPVYRERSRRLKKITLTGFGKKKVGEEMATPTASPTTFYPTVSAFPTITGFPTATLFPTKNMDSEEEGSSSSGKKSGKKSSSDKSAGVSKSGKKSKKGSDDDKSASSKKGKKDSSDDSTNEPDEETDEPTLEPTTPPEPTDPPAPTDPPPTTSPTSSLAPTVPPQPTSAPTPEPVPSDFTTELDLSAIAATYHPFFTKSAATWSQVITGDMLDYTLTQDDIDFSSCQNLPAVVDDIYICAQSNPIDGPGGVLAISGPESARFQGFSILPATGFVEIDTDDIDLLVADGRLQDVINQQFGFVYGIGVLWEFNGLLEDDFCTYKADTQASLEFQAISGCPDTTPVPSDPNTCTSWSEDCLQSELFTTDVGVGSNPLSRISIAALEDLGYGVNYGAADAFTAADLNPTCVCSAAAGVRKPGGVFKIGGTAGFDPSKFAGGKYSRGRLGGPRGSKPRLSTLGRRIAWRRGKQHLQALHEKKTQAVSNGSSGGSPDGSVFFGDRVVNVLYQERGHIYNVRVTASNKV